MNKIKEKNMAEKISAVYKITNTVTGDFYIGSSKDIKRRWSSHKWPSIWNKHPNNQMYIDMQKYGTDKFEFQILEEVKPEHLKEKEQQFIEKMHPTYNSYNAKGLDLERYKEYDKEYRSQLCYYNGETLTLNALRMRFKRAGIKDPVAEVKKYIIKN